jgi:hypothetical protein
MRDIGETRRTKELIMTAQTNVIWVAALTALFLLALPTSLLVREMITKTAHDSGQVILLGVYVALVLSVVSFFYVSC